MHREAGLGWISQILQPQNLTCESTSGTPPEERLGELGIPCRDTLWALLTQLWGSALQGQGSELLCPMSPAVVNVIFNFLGVVPPLPVF